MSNLPVWGGLEERGPLHRWLKPEKLQQGYPPIRLGLRWHLRIVGKMLGRFGRSQCKNSVSSTARSSTCKPGYVSGVPSPSMRSPCRWCAHPRSDSSRHFHGSRGPRRPLRRYRTPSPSGPDLKEGALMAQAGEDTPEALCRRRYSYERRNCCWKP
jgi:hypothetical protein